MGMHITTDPPILYFGTPVVLISTENEDASANLAPMSSAWWIGHRCVLGLANGSCTTQNLRPTGECVLNLPSASLVENVDRIARTTGSDPVPGECLRPAGDLDRFELAGCPGGRTEAVGARTSTIWSSSSNRKPHCPSSPSTLVSVAPIASSRRVAHVVPLGRALAFASTSMSVVTRGVCAACMANRAIIRPPTRHHRSSSPSCRAIAATVCHSRCSRLDRAR
jgi:flavin reductase (DIM6/NTAB) family NADH-FMN oxidoreductase RutF